MYSVEFTQTGEKQFSKLDQGTQVRIVAALDRCKIRPHHHVKKLVGNNYFSLRAGDYRIIFSIEERKLLILVIEVGHRNTS